MPQPPSQKPGGLGLSRLGAEKPRAGLESAADAAGQSHATDALAETCQHLEEELEELKAKYEMYFLGLERIEPARRRDQLKRDIARLKSAFTRNTGLRFRIQSLHARYLSYERMWTRAAREKEEGTYRRDLFKARKRSAANKGPAKPRPGALPSEDVDIADFTPAPGRRAANDTPAPNGAGPGSVATPSNGLSESQMRSLYQAYLAAKKRCNEDTSRLTYEAVAKSVRKQIPDLMAKFQAKAVDFQVVIKQGRAILKAVPRT